MKFLLTVSAILAVIFIPIGIFEKLTRKYVNKYKMYLLFAPKGEGKSILLQKLCDYYHRLNYNVYCNNGDTTIDYVQHININLLPYLAEAYYDKRLRSNIEKLETYTGPSFIKPESVIMCDEINLIWDNRDFKSFPKPVQEYFRLQRQYKHIFIGYSQTYDCDLKIRNLADYTIIIRKILRIFVTSEVYRKKPIIISPNDENNRESATMTDDFVKMPWLIARTQLPFRAYLPRWVRYNKSHRVDQSASKTTFKKDEKSVSAYFKRFI